MSNTGKAIVGLIILVLLVIGLAYLGKASQSSAPTTTETPTPVAETGPIKIGFTGPLSGDVANIGANARAAVEIAVAEVNAAGGINGRTLEMIYEDDKCGGPEGANAANKLINIDKVDVLLSAACSPSMLAIAPMAEKAKIPMLGYCASAATISNAGDYIFRDAPSDLFQAQYAAKYLYDLGKKKAAIVYLNNDWGVGLRDAFTESFTKLGGEVVLKESYDPDSTDLRTQMTKVKASSADLLYFPGFTSGTIAGLKQAKALGLKQTVFGADAWDDNKIWEELGSTGNGAMYTVMGTNSTDSFKAKMKEKLGNDSVIYCSNYAYDGVKILSQVMSKVGSNKEAIKNELYQTSYTGGVSSPNIKFDQNGDPTEASYVIKIIKNGKAELAS